MRQQPSVEVLQGTRVVGIEQDTDRVRVDATGVDNEHVQLDARFVIGADGGESFVRRSLDIGSSSYGFEENWLVCDFRKKRELDVPTFRQICDPAQPTSIVRIGPNHQRFSFMLARDARREEVTDPARVWARVSLHHPGRRCAHPRRQLHVPLSHR